MMWILTLLSLAVAGTQPLPFEGNVGGNAVTDCPAQYATTECDGTFEAVGEKGSLQLVRYALDRSVSAVAMSPTTSAELNGVRTSFQVKEDQTLAVGADLVAGGGESFSVVTEIVFKDARDNVIDTRQDAFLVTGEMSIEVQEVVPSDAVLAEVTLGADDQRQVPTATAANLGFLIWLWSSIADAPTGECDETDCSGQQCDISCPKGQQLMTHCIPMGPPSCTGELSCYCRDDEDKLSEPQRLMNWY